MCFCKKKKSTLRTWGLCFQMYSQDACLNKFLCVETYGLVSSVGQNSEKKLFSWIKVDILYKNAWKQQETKVLCVFGSNLRWFVVKAPSSVAPLQDGSRLGGIVFSLRNPSNLWKHDMCPKQNDPHTHTMMGTWMDRRMEREEGIKLQAETRKDSCTGRRQMNSHRIHKINRSRQSVE